MCAAAVCRELNISLNFYVGEMESKRTFWVNVARREKKFCRGNQMGRRRAFMLFAWEGTGDWNWIVLGGGMKVFCAALFSRNSVSKMNDESFGKIIVKSHFIGCAIALARWLPPCNDIVPRQNMNTKKKRFAVPFLRVFSYFVVRFEQQRILGFLNSADVSLIFPRHTTSAWKRTNGRRSEAAFFERLEFPFWIFYFVSLAQQQQLTEWALLLL